MYEGKTVAVVVPAYNESTQISKVVRTMPDFVDRIVVVNDGSTDDTSQIVRNLIADTGEGTRIVPVIDDPNTYSDDPLYYADKYLAQRRVEELRYFPTHTVFNANEVDKLVLIDQENSGKGRALSTGYLWCRNHAIDCIATMDGDGQMAPDELEDIISPVVCEGIDFVKGNRLIHPAADFIIPAKRRFGNSALSILTKIASGYWGASDSQCGYIAMSNHAINSIKLYKIYYSYGCPNDLMVKLNIANCTIREVMIRPVYNVGEQSKMQIPRVIPRISLLLLKCFISRMNVKYFRHSINPLLLFYFVGIMLGLLSLGMFFYILAMLLIPTTRVAMTTYISFLVSIVATIQSLGFAMFMDIQDNEKLQR